MATAHRVIEADLASAAGSDRHEVPPLPYDCGALEPVIDAQTLLLHHRRHHGSYVAALNRAIADAPALQGRSASWLLLNPGKVPQKVRTLVRHSVGGHLNHSLFWRAMSPVGQGGDGPMGALAAAITRDFGSVAQFREQFAEAGEKLFGSGWVWLVLSGSGSGKLQVCTTPGHGNPLSNNRVPILLNDVWEHAYYLKYKNRRSDYLREWWSVVNWYEASRRFDRASNESAKQEWEDEGGSLR